MKDVRKAIYEILRDDAGVTALASGRVYPVQMPQGMTSPSVVYHMVSENTDYNMNGASGLVSTRMQVDTWAASQKAAFDLANAVKTALSGFSGTVDVGTDSPPEQITIHGIFGDNSRDTYDSTAKLFASQRDYIVWHWEF